MTTFSYERLPQAANIIKARWEAKVPFSLVRLGDGELSVLEYPKTAPGRIQYVFRRAMSDRIYRPVEILDVKERLVEAVKKADLVGTYDSFEPVELTLAYTDTFQDVGVEWATITNPNIHIFLQSTGVLHEILESATRVTLIGGRQLSGVLGAYYPNIVVDQMQTPVERQYALDGDEGGGHYPGVFRRLIDQISPEGPGHLYLVGAGLLGKAYCAAVKERGGFALDIGSVFDYWAGVPTREGKQVIKDGKLVFEGESRWPNITLGSDYRSDALQRTPFRTMLRPQLIVDRPCP